MNRTALLSKPRKRKPATTRKTKGAPPSAGVPKPDERAALARIVDLMAIPGKSGQEAKVAQYIVAQLRSAGVPAKSIRYDTAHRRTPLAGEIGNLVLQLPGTMASPRRLLLAHMDTVPLCVGATPVKRGSVIRSADKATGVGADDRSGCAVVLTAALEILRRKLPHPPLTFLWAVQEEIGLFGARHADLALLGRPKLAFNFDGGSSEKITIGATGAYRIEIELTGRASHAGSAPQRGISAITIAGLAIAELSREGWLGEVSRNGRYGTSNIGVINGGAATNVVTDRVDLRAEARSHDHEFRREILAAFERAFENAAAAVRNVDGEAGKLRFTSRLDYESFLLPDKEPCVLAAEAAVLADGGEPARYVSNGGLDANWLTARGIPTVTLGCGQQNPHTLSEQLDVTEFLRACRVGLALATGTG